jgi:hypothetical protein
MDYFLVLIATAAPSTLYWLAGFDLPTSRGIPLVCLSIVTLMVGLVSWMVLIEMKNATNEEETYEKYNRMP